MAYVINVYLTNEIMCLELEIKRKYLRESQAITRYIDLKIESSYAITL